MIFFPTISPEVSKPQGFFYPPLFLYISLNISLLMDSKNSITLSYKDLASIGFMIASAIIIWYVIIHN